MAPKVLNQTCLLQQFNFVTIFFQFAKKIIKKNILSQMKILKNIPKN
jgi:hypothetical protein